MANPTTGGLQNIKRAEDQKKGKITPEKKVKKAPKKKIKK